MRLDRLLAIINLLLNRRKMSAPALAEYFEVTVRTIYRDIDAINAAGIPIVAAPGNKGGFGIMENYQLNRQVFTFKDMVATLSILKGVNRALGDKKIDAAIEKIQSLAPSEKKSQLFFETEQMAVDVLPWGISPEHREKLVGIQQAVSTSRLLRFIYLNSNGQKQSRVVEPMTIVFKGSSWYLFGYCRLRQDFRVFRVTRILKIEILNQTFARRPSSYGDYLEPNPKAMPMVALRLRFAPQMRYRLADYMDAELLKSRADGSVIAEMKLPATEWIYYFLLGFGEQVEVLAPNKIRRELAARLEKMTNLYSKSALKR